MSFLPFDVVEALGGDERSEVVRVGVRVLKVPTETHRDGFVARGCRLMEVLHPSLRRARQVGRLTDGRPFVLLDEPRGPTLSESPELGLREALEVGLALASAMGALHDAGLVIGPVRASDVFLSRPATLDASVPDGGDPQADIRSLVELLLKAGLRRGADSRLRARLLAAESAAELAQVLRSMLVLFESGLAAAGPTTVEVVEPDLSGNRLGPWLLERVVGEGAIGRVYLARHEEQGSAVAVKVLKREHAANAEVRHRFVLEAQAVNAVRDEHLVEVYDFGEVAHPGGPLVYCAMELLDGEPLADTLSRGPLEVDRAVRIAGQLALALHAAHLEGVIHRDVKPENVFLHRRGDDEEQVKVLDFGLAKVLRPIGGLGSPGTSSGIVVGTPEYMAPEQAMGMEVDLRADLFAVGLVLYELLTGASPYHGDTFARRVVELTHTTAPRLPDETPLGEKVPARLQDIVARCLEKEPEDRFQSGEELARALGALGEAEVVPADLRSTRPLRRWLGW